MFPVNALLLYAILDPVSGSLAGRFATIHQKVYVCFSYRRKTEARFLLQAPAHSHLNGCAHQSHTGLPSTYQRAYNRPHNQQVTLLTDYCQFPVLDFTNVSF